MDPCRTVAFYDEPKRPPACVYPCNRQVVVGGEEGGAGGEGLVTRTISNYLILESCPALQPGGVCSKL